MKSIPLTQGLFTKVDDDIYDFLMKWKWYAAKAGEGYTYAQRVEQDKNGKKIIKMHRQILGLKKGDKIYGDHIDGDCLNNQRHNLRSCTHSQNISNRAARKNGSSKYLGVERKVVARKDGSLRVRYHAAIRKDKIPFNLGYYKTEIEAAKAYNSGATYLHGKFANLNTF